MRLEVLLSRYPKLYHMAESGSWPSIVKLGLLSTAAALDFSGIVDEQRHQLERQHRPEKVALPKSRGERIVLRDQKPMDDTRLSRALVDGTTPSDWYAFLNGRVFFWTSEERLLRLLGARDYRATAHDVLVINTKALVNEYSDRILLCHMNSGNTYPIPHHRGMGIFRRIEEYPTTPTGLPKKEVVELTVGYSVPNISSFVERVVEMRGGEVINQRYP